MNWPEGKITVVAKVIKAADWKRIQKDKEEKQNGISDNGSKLDSERTAES